jgi:hypothetical protein
VQANQPQGGGVDWNATKIPFPVWIGTVSEAVFLLGAERNADKMFGAAYVRPFYSVVPDLSIHIKMRRAKTNVYFRPRYSRT